MTLAILLYVVFAALAIAGLFLIGKHFHSTTMGYKLATGGTLFFILLILGMTWLMSRYGGA